jgi:hypothetical protein
MTSEINIPISDEGENEDSSYKIIPLATELVLFFIVDDEEYFFRALEYIGAYNSIIFEA